MWGKSSPQSSAIRINTGYVLLIKFNRKYNEIDDLPEMTEYISVLDRAEKAVNHRSEADIVTNGHIVRHKVRFLARHGNKASYAVVSRNVSIHEESDKAESLQVAMAHVFNQYFRVDLYEEKGTVENIFLNTKQLAVADREMDAVEAVKIYSDMYLYPEDRERFRKFYDIPTVRTRCEEQGINYVVDYYHSAMPEDNGRMQMYMILPFYYNNSWKYISCCRYADEIRDDAWK